MLSRKLRHSREGGERSDRRSIHHRKLNFSQILLGKPVVQELDPRLRGGDDFVVID